MTSHPTNLPSCIVRTRQGFISGMLFLQTKNHIVVVNNVSEKTNLGPLQRLRREHLDPEATVVVIPRRTVEGIELLKR